MKNAVRIINQIRDTIEYQERKEIARKARKGVEKKKEETCENNNSAKRQRRNFQPSAKPLKTKTTTKLKQQRGGGPSFQHTFLSSLC
jgi:hypothetical protein